jgi:hypothetical protein
MIGVSKATIYFSAELVTAVNINSSIKLVWIMLDDGSQINIPLNVAYAIKAAIETEKVEL